MRKIGWWKTACAVCVLCAATAVALPAQTFTTLLNFDNTDGATPFAGLIQATDGNLYGTTLAGGASSSCSYSEASGCGTVFKITPNGTLTRLYSFCSQGNCTDGADPEGELLQTADGNFYGTTYLGGANGSCDDLGCGTVFEISPTGRLATLYNFCSQNNCTDGAEPDGGLIQAADGNLYGTTRFGGANVSYGGTVFKITRGGMLITLYSFCSQFDCSDGENPTGTLIQATDGNFYGTTAFGGANEACEGSGCGTVFKITPSGTFTTLYSFCSESQCQDGAVPLGGLMQAKDGNFYGTTEEGGIHAWGTVFKITPSGTVTTLHKFDSDDGALPFAGLIEGTDGNFYGTTYSGGYGFGTVFQVSASGALSTVQLEPTFDPHQFSQKFTEYRSQYASYIQQVKNDLLRTRSLEERVQSELDQKLQGEIEER
jgi:uncharacterized repeat protein (TIGR03803 family)